MIDMEAVKPKDNRGGANRGQGRKPKAVEEAVTIQAKAAIAGEYGSIVEGFIFLLRTGEPALLKFVFEHAVGKPKESIEHSGEIALPTIIFNQSPNCEPIEANSN